MNERTQTDADRDNRLLTLYVYGFQLLGLLLVFPPIIGLAINYARRERVRGSLYASHFAWQIRTVWWMLGWGIAGGALMLGAERLQQPLLGIAGAGLLLAATAWFTYRFLRGYLRLLQDREMPGPITLPPGRG